MTVYRYYTGRWPTVAGAIPELATLLDVNCFDQQKMTEKGDGLRICGLLSPLTDKQVEAYELSEGVEL